MRHLKKAEAQAEGRRLMQATSPAASTSKSNGTGGASTDIRPGKNPSETQWISPERAGDVALQVMFQIEENTDASQDLQLCTHGRGLPAFGQYLGEEHE